MPQGTPPKDIDLRSFLGDPLNVRIAVPASLERESGICQTVIDREGMLHGKDLQLTMVELRAARYILVRSTAVMNEPIISFALRIGCPGEPVVDREFTLLLDPPPFTVTPALPTAKADAKSGVASGVTASGNWTVVAGDTLQSIAKGIHPRNRVRQRQYLQAMRELNPELGTIADDAGLKAGTVLRSPDLKTLSGIAPGAKAKPATIVAPAPNAASEAPAPKSDAVSAPVKKPPPPLVAAKPPATVVARPQPPAQVAPAPSAPTVTPEKSAPKIAAKASPPVKAVEAGASFQLRLSSAEIDLSRSRNVTDEQRSILREKQMMLDSDDQVAALLSLRNTVKQLESRLNEMQLKMAVTTAASPAAVDKAPAKAAPAEAVIPAPTAAPAAIIAPPSDEKPAAVPAVAAPPSRDSVTSVSAKPPADPAESSSAESLAQYLPSPTILAAIAGGLMLLVGAWWWSKRGRTQSSSRSDDAENPLLSTPPATSMGPSKADTDFANWAEQQADTPAAANGPDTALPVIANGPAADMRFAPPPAAIAHETAEPTAEHQATVRIDSPVIFEDTPARYELDSTPATTVDFPLGLDDKPPEDRVRRLQYMHERYPELKTNTVSIDDADSVINAARLYYEENDNGSSGHDKACELLTFAVEERPQEIRFWLAQFEIFRLENMTAEFGELAAKFQMLFSHTPAWPKVRHIGHEIDPGNPLYAESGRPSLGGEARFDPIAENWLNAPMDFTSDALMSDLRQALLDDHNVTRADFEKAAAKLTAGAN